jgi:hypothetical protein
MQQSEVARVYSNNGRFRLEQFIKDCTRLGLIEKNGDKLTVVSVELDNVDAFMRERIYRGAVRAVILRIFELIQ